MTKENSLNYHRNIRVFLVVFISQYLKKAILIRVFLLFDLSQYINSPMLTYKLTNKGKNMKTLRNMLFAMLVSPLVFYSAQAEITLDGSLEVASTKQDGETGNPIGLENEMTLSASTELDNGFSVGYKMTLDADAFDDEELSFGTDYGTIAFTSAGGSIGRCR